MSEKKLASDAVSVTKIGQRAGTMRFGRNDGELARPAAPEPASHLATHTAAFRDEQTRWRTSGLMPRAEPRHPPAHAAAIGEPILSEPPSQILVLVPSGQPHRTDVGHHAGRRDPDMLQNETQQK